jgi:hypothetical protein
MLDDLLHYDDIPSYLRHAHAAQFLFDMYCKASWNKKNSNVGSGFCSVGIVRSQTKATEIVS